jgi:ABC-type multidrug transport system fused ATPase/permease subunit
MFFQVLLGFLDLFAVALVGLIGVVASTGIRSTESGDKVQGALLLLQVENLSFQQQVASLAIVVAILLVGKTVLSVLFTRKTIYFLSRRGALISSQLVSRLLSQSLLTVQQKSSQQTVFALTTGVQSVTLGVLANFAVLIADISLLIVLTSALLFFDFVTALLMIFFFVIASLVLFRLTSSRAVSLGMLSSKLTIESNEKIVEVLNSYRESVVRNRRDFYARKIGEIRFRLADSAAELQFMPSISKYLIESTVVLAAVFISGIQFLLQDATQAISTLIVFMAAGTRIAPAVMRVQQGLIQIKGSIGASQPTLELIENLQSANLLTEISDEVEFSHNHFISSVFLENVSFQYPGKRVPAISEISFEVPEGTFAAIVGPSGAGKTTLVDVLLGVIKPDSGVVTISTKSPLEAVSRWPGAIAYVPQDVVISDATIRDNIAMGFPREAASDASVWDAIEVAQLSDFVRNLPQGLDTQVGERGAKISGGQRQRLGIARAMFTKPKVLVLDEATSALDGQTEADISSAIQALKGSATVIMIAHRLSTVRDADLVVYMNSGRIISQGTFDEVRKAVPDFNKQAQLMGL